MCEPKVMIGIPMPKNMSIDLRTSYWCYRELDFGVGWILQAECGGSAARNKNVIIDTFLKGDYTHLFCLNNDTWSLPNTINKLLTHDKDIVAGITPGFFGEFFWMGQIEKNKKILLGDAPDKLTQAARAGGPGMLIKRKVLEAMEFPWFDFIQVKVGQETSEDYHFSDKAVDMGFEVWIDPNVILNHNHNGIDLLGLAQTMARPKGELCNT